MLVTPALGFLDGPRHIPLYYGRTWSSWGTCSCSGVPPVGDRPALLDHPAARDPALQPNTWLSISPAGRHPSERIARSGSRGGHSGRMPRGGRIDQFLAVHVAELPALPEHRSPCRRMRVPWISMAVPVDHRGTPHDLPLVGRGLADQLLGAWCGLGLRRQCPAGSLRLDRARRRCPSPVGSEGGRQGQAPAPKLIWLWLSMKPRWLADDVMDRGVLPGLLPGSDLGHP